MRALGIAAAVIALMLAALAAQTGRAQVVVSGDLQLTRLQQPPCPSLALQPGESVRIRAHGFAPAAPVTLELRVHGSAGQAFEHSFGEFSANAAGVLDVAVQIPLEMMIPNAGVIRMYGPAPEGRRFALEPAFFADFSMDSDGDGTPDACDNCREPNDQSDSDRDGQGDLCDRCPRDATNDPDGDGICNDGEDPCPLSTLNDPDADGLCGNVDNCPRQANPGQEDRDGDGQGDACETGRACSDGIDNDGDGLVDHPDDPGCPTAAATSESLGGPCDDGLDNDHDGRSDFRPGRTGDPGCRDPWAASEAPACDDGVDNDGDLATDFDGRFSQRIDPSCVDRPWYDDEGDDALDGPDQDGDGYRDALDPCPSYRNRRGMATRLNSQNIPAECQCGDGDRNGTLNALDLGSLAACANGTIFCNHRISDTDNSGSINALDIGALAQAVNGVIPWHQLRCARRPEGSPPASVPELP